MSLDNREIPKMITKEECREAVHAVCTKGLPKPQRLVLGAAIAIMKLGVEQVTVEQAQHELDIIDQAYFGLDEQRNVAS